MRTFYLQTNTKGIKEHNLFGNRKLAREYIIDKLKSIYKDYKEEKFDSYKTFIEKTRRLNEGEEFNLLINDTKIKLIKLELMKSKHKT